MNKRKRRIFTYRLVFEMHPILGQSFYTKKEEKIIEIPVNNSILQQIDNNIQKDIIIKRNLKKESTKRTKKILCYRKSSQQEKQINFESFVLSFNEEIQTLNNSNTKQLKKRKYYWIVQLKEGRKRRVQKANKRLP